MILAQKDCHKANDLEGSQRTHDCVDRINKLIKQSKKRDYYKILGVKRSADKNTINKAYRKLAHKWYFRLNFVILYNIQLLLFLFSILKASRQI
jgi:hypothetical protein